MNPDFDDREKNEQQKPQQEMGTTDTSGMTPSTAPNTSFETGAGDDALGYDSAPIETLVFGAKEIEDLDHSKPGESSTGEIHGNAEPDITAHHKTLGTEE
jgi:hypothetical protein